MRSTNFGVSYGWDKSAKAWVVNYTGNWIAFGVTTSPTQGANRILGLSFTNKGKKKVRDDEDIDKTLEKFRGLLIQLWLISCKLYLYIFFNGDGRS